MTNDLLRDAVRRLLLPIVPGSEDAAVAAVRTRLDALGVVGDDQPEFVRQLTDDWHATKGVLEGGLRDLVRRVIREGFPDAGPRLPNEYHTIHVALQQAHVLNFEEATALLSYAPVIRDLAVVHRMSSSAISRVIAAHGFRRDVPWRAVQAVLGTMQVKPSLIVGSPAEPATILGVLAADLGETDQRFLDADIAAGAALVGSAAAELGFDGDLGSLLLELCAPDGTTFVPYLQVLHFQAMVAAFYDHPLTMPYEFSPRGRNADFLLPTYQSLTHTLSAFLNNMKAIERLDNAWARGRDQERARAHTLVAVLEGMERLGFLPRVEVSAWVRQWLLRVIRLAAPPANPIPAAATSAGVAKVVAELAAMPQGTNTGGVIEQRIVDALASTIHPEVDGWRARGLGLPVNANNLSSRRLGDCDFQLPSLGSGPAELVAYEATAGRLTATYLAGHLQTLRRSITARIDELEGVAARTDWRIKVIFVAHEFAPDLPAAGPLPAADYQGLAVETEYVTYDQLDTRADAGRVVDSFAAHVHARLNEARTPRTARDKFLTMLP